MPKPFLPFLMLAAIAIPSMAQAQAQEHAPQISLEERMLLRCSAVFAMVSTGQENGVARFTAYPDIQQPAREFFVRASARVMDSAGLDRAAIRQLLSAEAQDMLDKETIDDVMQVCLPLLTTQ